VLSLSPRAACHPLDGHEIWSIGGQTRARFVPTLQGKANFTPSKQSGRVKLVTIHPQDLIRRRQCLWQLALALAGIFLISAIASAKAGAAGCTELEDCLNAGNIQKAVSDDDSNRAAWFRATSKQHFIDAYEWNQKATFAFHAGDATAAVWYKAIADDYSNKSVAEARAADDYANQARFWAAGADQSFRRYVFIANAPDGGDGGISTAKIGVSSLKKAKAICRGPWLKIACEIVLSKAAESGWRYFWKLVGGAKCLRQETRYDVNPSTGYVNRVYHVCVKLG
jgi:hypothetical protein